MPTKSELRNLVALTQEKRSQKFDKLNEYLNKFANEQQANWDHIVNMPFSELTDSLRQGVISPINTLHAYQQVALKAQNNTNCLVNFVTEAEQWAIELPSKYSNINDRPPLYGVPISIKEHISYKTNLYFWIAGYPATCGFACRIDSPTTKDAVVIITLKEQGAIPFAITNVPQTLMTYNCANPIYGKTTHPMDINRTPGGSSGGEGALLGCEGSILGIGTDGGGSIRIPSGFCGLAGIKVYIWGVFL